jgi:hypothetical protein
MSEGKQFNYQCRCCFLEVILYEISKNVASFGCCSLVQMIMLFFCCCLKQVYNGQIGDLLDPTQRNLEVSIYGYLYGTVLSLNHYSLPLLFSLLHAYYGLVQIITDEG